MNKWIDHRLNVLKNWELVRKGMLINKSTMQIMCSIELLEDVGDEVDFERNIKRFTRDLLRLLVYYYLDIPYYKPNWNQNHKNIYKTQKILIVNTLKENILREEKGSQSTIYVLANNELIEWVYEIYADYDMANDDWF